MASAHVPWCSMDVQGAAGSLVSPPYELIETHISWVLVGPREVYKIKKPVDLGFLDFSTLERRHAACRAEVELNRRLAPDVYLGVRPVVEGPDGPAIGGAGEIVDWAVHMRRLPTSDRADVRLAEGRLDHAHMATVAGVIADFHARARADEEAAAYGTVQSIRDNVLENFAQTRETIDAYLDPARRDELERFQLGFLGTYPDRFEQRRLHHRVRDGHGDLRLEHIYLADDGHVSIIDCIEFNERFRYADVCADIAFLAMDLARVGHVELAEHCLASYARASDDYDLYGVVDFYESYRAHVRAKIASIVAASPTTSARVREAKADEARRDYLLALSAHRKSVLSPMLVLVGGIIATGKSTIADCIGRERSAPVIDADRTRKHMLGGRPEDKMYAGAWQGAYDPHVTDRVYAELLRRADVVLASGRPVVLDASFGKRRFRDDARAL